MAVKESALEHTLPHINTGWGTHDDRRTVYFSRWYSRGMGKARPLLCWGTHFHLFLSDTHTHKKVLTAQKTLTQNKVKEEEYKSQICLRCSCGDGVLFLKRSGGVRFWNVQILPRFFFFFWLVTLMHRCRKFKVYIYPRDNHKSDSEWERTVLHVETSSIEFNELKTRVSFIKAFVKYYSTLVQHTSTFSLVASNSHWHLYKVSQHPATQLQVKPWLENVQINFKINLKFHHVLFISADQCFNQETPTLTQHRLN